MGKRKPRMSRAFRPLERGLQQTFGRRESKIMELLWKYGPQSPAELHAALHTVETVAYTTVYTELSRLVKKGFVQKSGRNLDARYQATLPRDKFVQMMVTEVLQGLIGAHGAAAIHGFVDLLADDEAALDQLRKVLHSKKAGG